MILDVTNLNLLVPSPKSTYRVPNLWLGLNNNCQRLVVHQISDSHLKQENLSKKCELIKEVLLICYYWIPLKAKETEFKIHQISSGVDLLSGQFDLLFVKSSTIVLE